MFASDTKVRPDGLVRMDDMVTRGVLVAMQKMCVQLVRDVQIASHTNRGSAILQGYGRELIRLEIDPTEIVQSMFEMLNLLMRNKEVVTPKIDVKAHLKPDDVFRFLLSAWQLEKSARRISIAGCG